jgi:4a-hydroxytetrahydrobiopterin dehydratase
MASRLSANDIDGRLARLRGWIRAGNEIRKQIECASFPAAIAFVTHVGFLAEAAGHHPDIDIRWRKVTLALTTHDAGGLTDKDFDLATQIDALSG